MCLLIVARSPDPEFPLLVASNRDEARDRAASPPGLFVGERRRMLSPRDRRAGGTWLAVNDAGMVAGLTNVAGRPPDPGAESRGAIPHLALDGDGVDDGLARVEQALRARRFNAFQLVVADRDRTAVLVHDGGVTRRDERGGAAVVVSNEHRAGELELPGLAAALAPGLAVGARLDALAALLLDEGGASGHRVLKRGGDYGTVSSSLIAVPRADLRALVWRYAPGCPDTTAYRSYGNLGRRLVDPTPE